MSETLERELGKISAHLENIKETQAGQASSLKSMDERLRKVETKGAVAGAVTGTIMAVAVGFIKNTFSS